MITGNLTTGKELAKFYGVSAPTFMAWFHAGIIPAEIAIGKVYRFDREKVAEALATQSKAQAKP